MSQTEIPVQGRVLKAGGGRSLALTDHQVVRDLSTLAFGHLERLYNDLVVSSKDPATDSTRDADISSFDAFQNWIKSPASAVLAPPPEHDLTLPLCNYYISSSHNTYLSGNQLYGNSTTEAYTNVLLRGCRCLEIDVWNGDDVDSSDSSSDEELEKKTSRTSIKKDKALSRFRSLKTKVKEEIKGDSSHLGHSRAKSPNTHAIPEDAKTGPAQTDGSELSLTRTSEERKRLLKWEPQVYHGYTLVKHVPFRDVCHAIRQSAFIATDLPIIVSLEVHCNLDQQQVMVDIMQEEWQGCLVDMKDKQYTDIPVLPSPNDLRNKILIKVKWTTDTDTGEDNNPITQAQSNTTDTSTSPEKKKKITKVLSGLSKLGVYTRAYSFKTFQQPEASIPTHVFSLDENKLGNVHPDPQHGPDMFAHNRNFLMRVYPSGLRVNSSNIDPTFGWRQGAQMVALNWQSLDKGMMLNEGMFAGEDGWVLKPEGFRSDSVAKQIAPTRRYLYLNIRAICAQNIPLGKESSIKPYVKFQLHVDTHGPPGQGKKNQSSSDSTANLLSKYSTHESDPPPKNPLLKTSSSHGQSSDSDAEPEARKLKRKTKSGKGPTTNFGDGSSAATEMIWSEVPDVVEELSFLRVKVMDDHSFAKDDLLAWACIRLDRLKTGVRVLHLLDPLGDVTDGFILVKIEKSVH